MPTWNDTPQAAAGYLYIMKPRTVFAARVNMATAQYPLAQLTYDGVTAGAWEDLEMGMTLLIGSAPGLWDLGRTYVRGTAVHECASSTTINIGYSSRGRRTGEVDLQDNAYITVLDLFEVWKRPSKGGSAPGSILKDYDWVATDRHLPVVHCGNTGGLGVLDFVNASSGVLELDFEDTGYTTNPVDPGWLFREWNVKDGMIISGSSTTDAITAEFPPGYRWIMRTAIDNDIRLGLPRRFCVVVLETEEDGSPALNTAPIYSAHKIRWTRKADGQTLTAELKQRLNPDDFIPGTVVMLLTAEEFEGEEGAVTGWTCKFAGYLDVNTGTGKANMHDTERGTVVTAVDVAGRLKQLRAFPSRIERPAGLALNANMIPSATIWRYLWWALVWHTSAPMLSDVELDKSGGEDYPFALFSNGGGSFYAVCDALARAYGRRFTCDSRGRLQSIVDPMRQEVASRTAVVQANITEGDWSDIGRVWRRPPVGVLKGSAVPVSTTPAASLLAPQDEWNAIAPGLVEGSGSGEEQLGYLSLAQNEPEFWARLGQDYARRNNPEDPIRLDLAHGNDAGIEPALMQWVTVTASEETIGWLDEALDEARCLPESVEFSLDDEAGALSQAVVVERETVGTPAVRDPRPTVVGRPVIRDPIVRPVPPSGFILRGGDDNLGFIDGGYLYYTLNGGILWSRINLSVTGTSLDFVPYAFSPLYRNTGNEVHLYHATTTRAARVAFNTTLLTALLTNQASYSAISNARIETERVSEGLVAIAKTITATSTGVIATTDAENWGSEEVINADGSSYGPPALYVSGKTEDRIYASEASNSGDVDGVVSNDGGGSFGPLSSPNLASKGAAYGLHVPFDQPGETIALFGGWDGANTPRLLLRANGSSTPDDISPQDGGESWGAQLQRAIDTDPNNRNNLAACLRNGDQIGDNTDVMRLYISLTGALGGWDYISDLDATIASGDALFNVRVAGDNSGVGWALGQAKIVKFRFEDGSYQDISGNLPTFTSPSVGIIPNLFGFGG